MDCLKGKILYISDSTNNILVETRKVTVRKDDVTGDEVVILHVEELHKILDSITESVDQEKKISWLWGLLGISLSYAIILFLMLKFIGG